MSSKPTGLSVESLKAIRKILGGTPLAGGVDDRNALYGLIGQVDAAIAGGPADPRPATFRPIDLGSGRPAGGLERASAEARDYLQKTGRDGNPGRLA